MRFRNPAHAVTLLALAALVALVAFVPPAVMEARQSDVVIAQRLQPVCNPQGATPYVYYNVTDGKWHCTATAPVVYNGSSLTATAAELNKTHTITAGTAAASKYVLLDSNAAIDIVRTASLRLGTSGSETAVTATATELNLAHTITAGLVSASKYLLADANKALDYVSATSGFNLGGTGVAGAAVVQTELTKTVTAIADATATDVLTITVPNAKHLAQLEICVTGDMGAGGAIGAGEAAATNCYLATIVRTSGVNAVGTMSSAFGAAAANVAGAGSVTATAALSAVTGTVSASNSFTVKITITKSGGSSANHVAFVSARVLNGFATGISIA